MAATVVLFLASLVARRLRHRGRLSAIGAQRPIQFTAARIDRRGRSSGGRIGSTRIKHTRTEYTRAE